MYRSYLQFNGTVLVTCFLYLLSFSAKGSNPSLFLFHTKFGLKQITFILTETILRGVFFARPIDDEDEHSRNDGWECF